MPILARLAMSQSLLGDSISGTLAVWGGLTVKRAEVQKA